MAHLILRSQNETGILDTGSNIVTLKGKEIRLDPNLVPAAGDIIIIRGQEFIVFEPDPVLFPDFSRRTAQIIQPWDAAVILHYCSISPGKKVLESGIGSGALSLSILRAIGSGGRLTTVEINRGYVENASRNVRISTDASNWEIVEGPVESFSSDEKFDVAVLDVPEPWAAIQNVSKLLKKGGWICTYSPTYNQLEKNSMALKQNGFHVHSSVEILKRDILVRENSTRPDNNIIGHTAFMTFAVKLSGSSIRA